MAFSNSMTRLLNKIENRLGVKILLAHINTLPPEKKKLLQLGKNDWANEVIIPDTLVTFSRYFPNMIEYPMSKSSPSKDGWYIIDEEFVEGVEILGARDIDWTSFTNDSLYYAQEMGYGAIDYLALQSGFSVEDVAMIQMRKDMNSLFNSGIFVDFKPPNMIKLTCATNANMSRSLKNYKIILLIKHADSLLTIPATMFETFEKLAIADVAGYLYRNLKYFDGLETVYASIDLKLSELEEKASRRDDIVQILEESSVSASNQSVPVMMTI